MKNKLIILVLIVLCGGISLILLNVEKDDKGNIITTTSKEIENINTTTTQTSMEDVTTSKKTKTKTSVTTTIKSNKTTKSSSTTTKKESTTKKSTTRSTTKKYVVKTENEQDISTETKYGVVIKTVTNISYNVYNDGTKKETSRDKKTTYDRSGYNATTSDLKGEALKLVNSNSSILNDVLKYTNIYRNEVSTHALVLDKDLSVLATIRALEIAWADKFSHTRPDNKEFYTVFSDMNVGYKSVGENIAAGYGSAKSVSEGWKNSSGHYKNMISDKYNKLGVGYVKHNGSKYWVQIFSN